ncbi:hypothetical protein [Streptomyces sp. NPDC006645]|uniref:hypothetical protein n=1 Tax=unclassified Streptomyces TaxID=2593676 RepID=UPI0033BBCC84
MDQRQNPGIRTGAESAAQAGTQGGTQRLELSVPQVAGSALAAVAAAVFASKLGVYGTIIGAGVVSVIATCGGTVFQHLFRRTGDQIREVSVQVKPRARQVYDSEPAPSAPPLRQPSPQRPSAEDEFGGATTYGTRVRGWKRSVVAAVVVFAVAMLGITAYELAAGQDLSGGKGTTFSSVVRGGDTDRDPSPDKPAEPGGGGPSPSDDGTGGGDGTDKGTTPDPGASTGGTPDPSAPGDGQSPNTPETGGPSTAPSPETSQPGGDSGGSADPGGRPAVPPPSTAPTPAPSGE